VCTRPRRSAIALVARNASCDDRVNRERAMLSMTAAEVNIILYNRNTIAYQLAGSLPTPGPQDRYASTVAQYAQTDSNSSVACHHLAVMAWARRVHLCPCAPRHALLPKKAAALRKLSLELCDATCGKIGKDIQDVLGEIEARCIRCCDVQRRSKARRACDINSTRAMQMASSRGTGK
jgi:hypothetical protein